MKEKTYIRNGGLVTVIPNELREKGLSKTISTLEEMLECNLGYTPNSGLRSDEKKQIIQICENIHRFRYELLGKKSELSNPKWPFNYKNDGEID